MAVRTELFFDGRVLRLLLDTPKGNVLDAAMIAGLRGALRDHVDAHTRLLVFEGAGPHFSVGASVAEHQAPHAAAMLDAFHGLFADLAERAIPTCAVVRGCCLGGGLELASWCTRVVATPDASFAQPEIRLGLFPPMASVLLPWRCGGAAALELCVTGRALTASEALDLRVVDAVSEDPDAWWRAWYSTRLASASAVALRFAEKAVRRSLLAALERDLPALERLYLHELMHTHDANEGLAAFLARRPPEFVDA